MKKILLLEGGFNEEHKVSINTSKEVKKSLARMKVEFEVTKVDPTNFFQKIQHYDNEYLCFNALHGSYGEDGTIQNILEKNKFSYTHSNSRTSEIAFDKNLTKSKIKQSEVVFIESFVIDKFQLTFDRLNKAFDYFNSFVLKPVSSGSSYGVKIFNSIKEIENFFLNYENEIEVYKNHNKLMIEKYIRGREITVAVLENKGISEAIEVTEIISSNYFFDYSAKYSKGLSHHIIPANLPKEIYQQCLFYAKTVHDKLGCRGISRSDFLYDEKKIYFLEINSQPGLTSISLVPEQLSYRNVSFDLLIKRIIEASL